jgi:hypothetical protein
VTTTPSSSSCLELPSPSPPLLVLHLQVGNFTPPPRPLSSATCGRGGIPAASLSHRIGGLAAAHRTSSIPWRRSPVSSPRQPVNPNLDTTPPCATARSKPMPSTAATFPSPRATAHSKPMPGTPCATAHIAPSSATTSGRRPSLSPIQDDARFEVNRVTPFLLCDKSLDRLSKRTPISYHISYT